MKFLVCRTDQEEVDVAAVHSDRHRQPQRSDRRRNFGGFAQCAAHFDRGAGRAARVVVAVEEQQQRVAAEFQQHAAVVVGDVDHDREHAAQCFDEFFATRPTA